MKHSVNIDCRTPEYPFAPDYRSTSFVRRLKTYFLSVAINLTTLEGIRTKIQYFGNFRARDVHAIALRKRLQQIDAAR